MSIRFISRKKPRSIGSVLIICVVLLVLAGGVTLAIGQFLLPADGRVAARGVTLADGELSGLTRAEADTAVRAVMHKQAAHRLTLQAGSATTPTTPAALGVTPDFDATLAAAYAVGRDGTLAQRITQAYDAHFTGVRVTPVYTLNEAQMHTVLKGFAARINREPTNASGQWDGAAQRLVITPELPGARLDIPASTKILRQEVLQAMNAGASAPATAMLPYREKIPRIRAAQLEPIDAVLATYSTAYRSSSRNRAKNVELAAAPINGYVLLPGDEFSFNNIVGPRTAADGFLEAPVIMNGQLQPGMGGGICQVSTTLYNAALLANMSITKRSHHSLPVAYAPPGLDATVAFGAIDFRFANAMQTPVIIEAQAQRRMLTVRLLGKGPAPTVRLVRSNIRQLPGRTVTKHDPALPAGTRVVESAGTSGKAVTVTRVVGEGQREKREVISKDRYLGEPRIIRVGTGAVKAAAAVVDTVE